MGPINRTIMGGEAVVNVVVLLMDIDTVDFTPIMFAGRLVGIRDAIIHSTRAGRDRRADFSASSSTCASR